MYKTKSCLFCRKGGFPYDHTMLDTVGNTICPKLLATQCTKCGEMGHTFKYCKQNRIQKDNAWNKKIFQSLLFENTNKDSEISRTVRNATHASNIKSKFITFLKNRYGNKWLEATMGTEFDCVYLRQLREEEMLSDWRNIYELATWLGNKDKRNI